MYEIEPWGDGLQELYYSLLLSTITNALRGTGEPVNFTSYLLKNLLAAPPDAETELLRQRTAFAQQAHAFGAAVLEVGEEESLDAVLDDYFGVLPEGAEDAGAE